MISKLGHGRRQGFNKRTEMGPQEGDTGTSAPKIPAVIKIRTLTIIK